MHFIALALLATLILTQTACGFQPIYGNHDNRGPVADDLNDVAIDNIPDHDGQMLRNDLIDRMYGKGRPASPRYHLSVTLRQTEEDIGILADATASRTLLNMYADYVLKDMNGKELLKGTAHSVTSYDKLSNQYGTLTARESSFARTINEANEQIVNRLSLYFAEGRAVEAPAAPAPERISVFAPKSAE